MKRRCIAVILLCVFIAGFGLYIRSVAFGDGGLLTAAQVGAAALGVGSSLGIDWTMYGAGPGFAGNWIGQEVQNYDNGESLIEAVSQNIAVNAAGQLAIGQVAYNQLCEFVEWLRSKYDLSNQLIGTNNIVFDPQNIAGSLNGWAPYPGGQTDENGYYLEGWSQYGALPFSATVNSSAYQFTALRVNYLSNAAYAYYDYTMIGGIRIKTTSYGKNYRDMDINPQKQAFVYPETYDLPTVLNPDQGWTGTIGQHSVPDTNLEDLLDGALADVEGGNLDVDGEIVDVPVPPGPVPTWTPVDDVIDGINQTGEILNGIGNDIGDISGHLDDIGDQIDGIEDSLEGVQKGIETQTGVISGAIDQAKSDVVDAIGEQTAALDQTLTETAEGVQDIAEALQPGEIEPKKFDLRGLFPFCIPFDIHNLLQKFQAAPVAPHVQLPFVIQSIGFSYTFDLDFSVFDSVAAIMRTVEYIVFAIGLAWATSKVIKW